MYTAKHHRQPSICHYVRVAVFSSGVLTERARTESIYSYIVHSKRQKRSNKLPVKSLIWYAKYSLRPELILPLCSAHRVYLLHETVIAPSDRLQSQR